MTQNFEQSDMLKRLPEQFFAKLVGRTQEFKQQGHDVINLGQGNPDLPTPDHIIQEVQEAAKNPANHKYAPFRGFHYFKEAAANYYKREYGVSLDPETEIAVLFGGKAGLVEISQCLLNPNDTALLPDPGYPDYMSGIAMADADPYFMPLQKDNHFLPDYSTIPGETLNQAKLMFLNYPNNPTAVTANKDFYDETVKLAKDHHICVVQDFAYGALGFDGQKPQSFLQSEGAKDIGIEIYTLSKTYNMAGWRVAFAAGNPSVIEALNKIQDHMYVSLFGAIQSAAAKALNSDQSAVQRLIDTYTERRDRFIRAIREIGWDVDTPEGSFFAWLPVPSNYTSEEFSNLLLENAHVVVAPGRGFGKYGDGYVRVGLLESAERLEEAAARIGRLGIFRKGE
ncbi:pyridoxal phosphate-dependent aminotransferase [Lentibacillus jeotgali]|uniref:pyridoxal phosphate-dependent aminotransferase n=1 Tax=Lentibacillus jeotgali TaxID=558169 RepID=UPI000262884D|nr:pyridoxal phosphate-dependent aminotransferase [Lentibacillus jeotgali]